MRTRPWIAVLLLLVPLVAACESAEEAEEAGGEDMNPADVRAAVDAVRDTWMQAAAADDAAGVAALYTEDAVLLDQFGVQHVGRAAIEAFLVESFAASTDISTEVTSFGSTEDAAFESGTWTQTVEGPDGPMTLTGQYTAVSVRGEDGAWQIALHMSSVPQPMPEGM